jgi:hypothetical protein
MHENGRLPESHSRRPAGRERRRARRGLVAGELDRLEARFERIEGVVLRDLGERIARLEASRD